jgi:hypothetical protein
MIDRFLHIDHNQRRIDRQRNRQIARHLRFLPDRQISQPPHNLPVTSRNPNCHNSHVN